MQYQKKVVNHLVDFFLVLILTSSTSESSFVKNRKQNKTEFIIEFG